MLRIGKKFLIQIGISAFVAVATPALAAGVMAATVMVSASDSDSAMPGTPAYAPDMAAGGSDRITDQPQRATHAPTRLSILAGNDKAAWDSANSVHVARPSKTH